MPTIHLTDKQYSDLSEVINVGLIRNSPNNPGHMDAVNAYISQKAADEGVPVSPQSEMAKEYPQYFKDVTEVTEMDTYLLNTFFPVQDDSGCLLHARKKLLIPGVRSGAKPMAKDIREARDTLNRWLQINGEDA
jgi:hypothetical protein